MALPLTQITNSETGETVIREMDTDEYKSWQAQIVAPEPTPTKEQLLAQLQALQAQIQALE